MSTEQPGLIHLVGFIAGEMSAEDIPLSEAAKERLAALTQGDDDVLPVVVGVGVGKGGRGWRYTAPYLRKFVDRVNDTGMLGLLGHQRDEDLGHQFPNPVTHWLAATFDENAPVMAKGKPTGDRGVAYFRGVVDKTAADLKRWIRGRAVTQPSIFGRPKLRRVGAAGEFEVYDGEPLSIDWSPLGRAGMQTAAVLAWGEMDSIGGDPPASEPDDERSGTVGTQETLTELRTQGVTPDQVIRGLNWRAADLVPVLAQMDRRGLAEALPRDVLGGVAVGEIAASSKPEVLIPAYNLKLADVAPIVDRASWDSLQAEHTAYGEMATVLDLEPSKADPKVILQRVRELVESGKQAERSRLETSVGRVVAAGEMAVPVALRPLVTERVMTKLVAGADETKIKQAVGEVKADPTIKPLIDASMGTVIVRGSQSQTTTGSSAETSTVGLPMRRRSI